MANKVLLVDDEQDFLEVMSERMENRGMEVSTANSAQEALEKIELEAFDAIILDFMMPEMDGLETIKAIKKIKPELQIILLTGQATLEKGVEAMKLGAMDVLEKPADIEVLAEKVEKAGAKKTIIIENRTQSHIKDMLKKIGW
jgi:DNA-binding NtrC family response regulator